MAQVLWPAKGRNDLNTVKEEQAGKKRKTCKVEKRPFGAEGQDEKDRKAEKEQKRKL